MVSGGLDDMERRIEQWATQAQEKAQRYQQLKQDITEISATASAANGAITVTVGPSGILQDLRLTDDVQRMRGQYLGEQIMTAMRKAQSTLGAQVTQLMQDRVGDDATSIDVVARNYASQFPEITDETAEPQPPQPATPRTEDDYFANDVLTDTRNPTDSY